jgi:hypothetical protein
LGKTAPATENANSQKAKAFVSAQIGDMLNYIR